MSGHRILTSIGLLVAAPLVLAGCGSSATSGSDGSTAAGSAGSASAADDTGSTKYPTQSLKACDVLTEAVAKSVLGSVAPASSTPAGNSSPDITVTTCSRTNAVTSVPKSMSATLLMRVAKTSDGATSNEQVFASPPAGTQNLSGYGEKAFWNPQLGQLNILDHGNWYILTVGPIDPRKHTLAESEKLATAIRGSL